MFDWNDEELANIIWGDTGESDDHTVPYSEGSEDRRNEKEWGQETLTTRQTEHKILGSKIDIHGKKLENCAKFEKNEEMVAAGFSMDSRGDLSVSDAAKTDQDSRVSESLTGTEKYNTSTCVETAELEKDPEVFRNPHEDEEQGDFVNCGWANIGSFDDLDRIFSNEDPIFGHVSLCSSDGLWSSSKDVINSPSKSLSISSESPNLGCGALRNTSENLEIKTEYGQQDHPSYTHGCGKDPISHGLPDVCAVPDDECVGGKRKPVLYQTDVDMVDNTVSAIPHLSLENNGTPNEFSDKVHWQRKLLIGRRKSVGKGEGKLVHSWSPTGKSSGQFENQLAHSIQTCSPSVVGKQTLHALESLQYQHAPKPFVSPSSYGNLNNTYPTMPVLLHQTGELKHQPLVSGNEIPRWDMKRLTMTPREKIEKLRRRQQMQAMLAIQKQQMQFHCQAPCVDNSIPQECSVENQIQYVEGADHEVEDLRKLPPLNPNSPLKPDDCNTIPMVVETYPMEEMILYTLQDAIAKLDIKIRLCMRDSLFRLAQSAKQRQYTSDTNSTNKSIKDEHEIVTKQESNVRDRYNASMPNVETETNSIDRIVAYLLFHRPSEISAKHPEAPKLLVSTKSPSENKNTCLDILPICDMPDSSEIKQSCTHERSINPCNLDEPQHMDMFKHSPRLSCSDSADGGSMELEACH